jgi:hypothetical protein
VNSLLLCPISAPFACGNTNPLITIEGVIVAHTLVSLLTITTGVACFDAKQFKCVEGNLKLLGADDKKAMCP